jgi:hypothetical protein
MTAGKTREYTSRQHQPGIALAAFNGKNSRLFQGRRCLPRINGNFSRLFLFNLRFERVLSIYAGVFPVYF